MAIKKIERSDFPFQNTSLSNLVREKWKDFPGYEGYYKISNYGRIKTLSRETLMNSPAGGVYMSQEKIRKTKMEIRLNKTVGENLYTVMITLSMNGVHKSFSVPRMVYFVFGEKFDLDDRSTLISYKDGDGRNTHISNLSKKSARELKLRTFELGRAISHLSVLSKPVTQFDANGHPVQVYRSMYEAGKKTGFRGRNIGNVVNGDTHMYKGFFWKLGKHKRKLKLNSISRKSERANIHRSLMKRLGIQRLTKKIPPYLNLSTESMVGELWKDVPDYEGLYKISNLGRVKALQKVSSGKQQKWMPEQIQRIQVDFRTNNKGQEVPGSTFASMAKDRRKKLVSIPRLVYFLFVKKFDLSDTTWRVYYKDGNSLNVVAANLLLKRGVYSILKSDT